MRRLVHGLSLALLFLSTDGGATAGIRTLAEYRYLRAVSIDFTGRIPTPAMLDAFERPSFALRAFQEGLLRDAGYAERMARVYQDRLRLELAPAFQPVSQASVLRRTTIMGPDGKDMHVYFRQGQRRTRPETDGTFCLSHAETGLQFPRNGPPTGEKKRVGRETLARHTREVRPWWLYRDYRNSMPREHYEPERGQTARSGFVLTDALARGPDGRTPSSVRVCAEEASEGDTGTVYRSGRRAPAKGALPPFGRSEHPPSDSAFALANAGASVSCRSQAGYQNASDCGCGVGLERCLPSPGDARESPAFRRAPRFPIGEDAPLEEAALSPTAWVQSFWAEEAARYLRAVFAEDRDVRELLTGQFTDVNGPLVQFYRDISPSSCCGQATALGYTSEVPLFEPSRLPTLAPSDVQTWRRVESRGGLASGLLTMPIFLTKYGTHRARAHVLYQTFACREFVAEDHTKLLPSSEPDLMKRDGCRSCHLTLEPLAAYFSRVAEGSWMFLPTREFPLGSERCRPKDLARMGGACKLFYDAAQADDKRVWLRGAKADLAHAEAGPRGLAATLTQSPDFAPCVARQIATSLLGRPIAEDEGGWLHRLAGVLQSSGYRPRAMVREIINSPQYRLAEIERPRHGARGQQ